MKKSDIQFHSDSYRAAHPALNVKCHSFPSGDDVTAHFKCEPEDGERAAGFAWDHACEMFWEQIQELAEFHLGSGVEAYGEGRCSGWLVVHNLPDVETWDAVRVSAWGRFALDVKKDIAFRVSSEAVFEDIEANAWYKPHAEKFNFINRADGPPVCIADLKADAIAAGFGAVVRD